MRQLDLQGFSSCSGACFDSLVFVTLCRAVLRSDWSQPKLLICDGTLQVSIFKVDVFHPYTSAFSFAADEPA